MFGWLRKFLLGNRDQGKVEVIIHVPEIRIVINGGGCGAGQAAEEGRSGSLSEEEGYIKPSAPAVTDDERLEHLQTRLGKTSLPKVAFGQQTESDT